LRWQRAQIFALSASPLAGLSPFAAIVTQYDDSAPPHVTTTTSPPARRTASATSASGNACTQIPACGVKNRTRSAMTCQELRFVATVPPVALFVYRRPATHVARSMRCVAAPSST